VEHDGDRNHHDATEALQACAPGPGLVSDSGVHRNRGMGDVAFPSVLFYRADGPAHQPCCGKMIPTTNTSWIAIMDCSPTPLSDGRSRIITMRRCSEQDADETDAEHRS
jgi:hypothetical protein